MNQNIAQQNDRSTIAQKLMALAVGLSAVILPTAAIAQEYAGCYWIDERGKRIDLGNLCPEPIALPAPEVAEDELPPSLPDSGSVDSDSASPESRMMRRDSGVVIAPIVRRDAGIPVIRVTFDDREYDMLLDTGASVVVLPNRVARELGLQATGSMLVSTASEARVEFGMSTVSRAELGSIVIENLDVAIAGDNTLDIGLLGQNFYGNYDLTIRQNVVELRRRSSP